MSLTISRYWSDISNTDISLRGLVGLVDLLWDSLDGESKVALFSLPLQHNK